MSKPEFLRGKGEAKIPLQAGGSGAIQSIDHLTWNFNVESIGSIRRMTWPIHIAAGGEYLVCQAMWQPSGGAPVMQTTFLTGRYDIWAGAQPETSLTAGFDRIFQQQFLGGDFFDPADPDNRPPMAEGDDTLSWQFDTTDGGDVGEWMGWVLHVAPGLTTFVTNTDS